MCAIRAQHRLMSCHVMESHWRYVKSSVTVTVDMHRVHCNCLRLIVHGMLESL